MYITKLQHDILRTNSRLGTKKKTKIYQIHLFGTKSSRKEVGPRRSENLIHVFDKRSEGRVRGFYLSDNGMDLPAISISDDGKIKDQVVFLVSNFALCIKQRLHRINVEGYP